MNKRTQSSIWEHFLRADNGQSVECKHCKKILKTPGGATGALHTHMRAKHIGEMPQVQDSQRPSTSTSSSGLIQTRKRTNEPSQKKIKLTDYFSNMEVRVTRMAALDGITLSTFCTSEDLRYLFKNSGYDIPKSSTTITKIILDQSDNTKNQLKKQLKIMKSENKRFTITFDEWTSTRNKRYMNINIHNKDFDMAKYKNLGLVRIHGSMPAEVGTQLLQQHLSEFGLNLEDDIIAFTTDGASVMVKMGRNFDGHHQLCLAHGIQLAVLEVLYKTQKSPKPEVEEDVSNTGAEEEEEIEEDEDAFILESTRVPESEFLYKDTIKKLRDLIKSFKNSPLKNDLLQKYVLEEYGKNVDLILDCKTRWNSLSDMVGRFLKLKSCVFKALLDLKLKSNVKFTDEEIQDLHEIHYSLDVIKTTVLSLCHRDSNLLTADAALRFMLEKLDLQSNDLSAKLATTLRKRIKERRTNVFGVLQYLHNNEEFFKTAATEYFTKPSSDEIRMYIVALLERLKYNSTQKCVSSQPKPSTSDAIATSDDDDEELTIAQQLEKKINKVTVNKPISTVNTDLDSIIRVEMCIYDSAGGGREVFLTAAYNYLLSITPTSVEAERAFSSAGYFCNKLRSSLGDKTLNALSFMRSYFQEKRLYSGGKK